MSGKLKAHKIGPGADPSFPSSFVVVKRAVLQKTDLENNNNKYYNIELHEAGNKYRVYTQYGRTDDLERNPQSGAREARYPSDRSSAESEYALILKEKTGPRKGYVEVALAASLVGSSEAHGKSSGHIDAKTAERIEVKDKPVEKPVSILSPDLRRLVSSLYNEATSALTSTLNATITAQGIKTPLGVLTLGQIDTGENLLKEIGKWVGQGKDKELKAACSAFYSAIPHKLGRTREALSTMLIDTADKVAEKQDVLQLMRDMLKVNGESGGLLASDDVDKKYLALDCTIEELPSNVVEELRQFMLKTELKKGRFRKINNIYRIQRNVEHIVFEESLGNVRTLFHGSRPKNWVGILSRGILLPKVVTGLGVHRTDAGWLGNGIYFGDAVCTSAFYAQGNSQGNRYIALTKVALGKSKDFTKITYGMDKAPDGYDSTHGIRRQSGLTSQFDDDEYCVYRQTQQCLVYLAELS